MHVRSIFVYTYIQISFNPATMREKGGREGGREGKRDSQKYDLSFERKTGVLWCRNNIGMHELRMCVRK